MDNNKKFFKIIIPNFNNIAYINRCLKSIAQQTFKDFVAIVIDDQSTDLSFEIAQMYARNDSEHFIALKAKEKCYAGGCRNIGIEYPVESEYTWFVDSDDYLASNDVLMNIYNAAIHKPDIIRCSYLEYDNISNRYLRLDNNINKILIDGPAPFKTCVKTSKNVKFVANRAKNNDVIWFLRLFDSIDFSKISYVEQPCCVYNRTSITSCQNSKIKKSKRCIDADRMIVDDLHNEIFVKPEIIQRKNRNIQRFSNLYKDKIQADDIMKYSQVITIDKNRFEKFVNLFKKNGFKNMPNCLFGSTDINKSGPMNCKLSHMMAVKYAKQNKWPYVAIFEDDAYPCMNIVEQLNEYLYAVPKDTKLLLLGWCSNYHQKQIFTDTLSKITTSTISGSQSYIVFENGYDDFLEFHELHPKNNADNTVFFAVQPSYIVDTPLFIQYCEEKSMNGHYGYIYHGHHKDVPLPTFCNIEEIK